jgi:peroxiredoxin
MNAHTLSTPPLQVSRWFNTPQPITLEALRGKIVVIYTFQMLCPACVLHSLPQATKLRASFAQDDVAVIGLHTVFEHHPVMGADALEAFIHEYRLRFPIGVDEADPNGAVPKTMAAWGLRGTPSLVLFDRDGLLRLSHFGHLDDLVLGSAMGQLLGRPASSGGPSREPTDPRNCTDGACSVAGGAASRLNTLIAGRVQQVLVGRDEAFAGPGVTSAIAKQVVAPPVAVGELGLIRDEHADRRVQRSRWARQGRASIRLGPRRHLAA